MFEEPLACPLIGRIRLGIKLKFLSCPQERAPQKFGRLSGQLGELRRGVEERREMIRSGEIERSRAARDAAQKAADAQR